MQLVLEFNTIDHLQAVYAYYERTRTPGQHVDVPTQQTSQGNGVQPVATYTAPVATYTAPVAAVAEPLDGAGIPWNGSFHASTKTQTLKGRWKSRKGRDEAAAAAYEARFGTPQAGVPVAAAPGVGNGFMPAAPVVVYPAPAAAFSFGAPAGPSPVGCTPVEFMTMANHLMSQGKLDNAAVMCMCQEIGVTDPNALASDDMARAKIYGKLMAISSGAA